MNIGRSSLSLMQWVFSITKMHCLQVFKIFTITIMQCLQVFKRILVPERELGNAPCTYQIFCSKSSLWQIRILWVRFPFFLFSNHKTVVGLLFFSLLEGWSYHICQFLWLYLSSTLANTKMRKKALLLQIVVAMIYDWTIPCI